MKYTKYTEMTGTDSCVICCEPMANTDHLYRLECGHEYHTKCIVAWFRKSNKDTCCLCRDPGHDRRLMDVTSRAKEIIQFVDDPSTTVSRRVQNRVKKYRNVKSKLKQVRAERRRFEQDHASVFDRNKQLTRDMDRHVVKIDVLKERLVPLAAQAWGVRVEGGSPNFVDRYFTVKKDIVSLARKFVRKGRKPTSEGCVPGCADILYNKVQGLVRRIRKHEKKLARLRKTYRAFLVRARPVFKACSKYRVQFERLKAQQGKEERRIVTCPDRSIPLVPLFVEVAT